MCRLCGLKETQMSDEAGVSQETEMEGRVAHAVCPLVKPWMDGGKECRRCERKSTPYGEGTPLCLLTCLGVARAAIRAMREPTKDMALAGDDVLSDCMDSDWSSNADGDRFDYNYLRSGSAGRTWQAMIDAATPPLKEPSTAPQD
jgi:hypothetical protein